MKKLLLLIAISIFATLLNGCGGEATNHTSSAPTPPPSNRLIINGSTTLLPFAQKAVEVFGQRKPEVKISISGGGSGIGINALVDGINDIAMSSRELKSEEKEKLGKKKVEAKGHIVAWDGIVPIVHPSNPVKNLTLAQLKDIYTGKVADWSEVGGKKGNIVVVSRDTISGTYEAWEALVLNNEPVVKSARSLTSSEAVLETVASTPNAIGYDGIGYAEGNNRVKPLSVEGNLASASNILDKSYKIARPLYMFTRGEPKGTVADFLKFMMSSEGQALVEDAKFVPVSQK